VPAAKFAEHFIDADGFRIRYMEAGEGAPLIHLHGAGGPGVSRGIELLSARHRVIAFEMPGFGRSAENTRTANMEELAATMANAIAALGIARYNLLGTSFGAIVALWLAAQHPDRVIGIVLESPGAIRPAGVAPPTGTAEQVARALYAHPDRMPALRTADPAIAAKTRALAMRLRGPDRDATLEARMRVLAAPTLVLFGTLDSVMPPEMGRHYKEHLPNCHLVFVYDTAHAISSERPEAFAEVTLDFLERHEAFVINRAATVIHP
jgi:pimeloyl-ACP methyl ester carboxylesterase